MRNYNRKIAASALVAGFIGSGLIAYAQPENRPDRPPPPPPRELGAPGERPPPPAEGPGRPGMGMERMFGVLTEEQRASFRDAMAGQSDKIRDLDERLRAARKHMMDAALAKDFDEKAVRQIALDAARLDAEMMVVRMKALAQVRPRLAPEQVEKMRSAPPPGAPEGAGERLSRRPEVRRDENGLPLRQTPPPPPPDAPPPPPPDAAPPPPPPK